ncbi:MAG: DUF5916 domain-containing protein [Terriglobales bacterium]
MSRALKPLTFVALLLAAMAGFAQRPQPARLQIPRLSKPPALEDFLSMEPVPEWRGKMAVADGFRQWRPKDGAPSTQKTVAYLGYDDKNLYVVFVCFDDPKLVRAHLTARDTFGGDDFVDLWLDTFHEHHRMYEFVSNPLGVQSEGIDDETTNNEDFTWDTVWHSRGKLTDKGYVVWMAIPFKSVRFPNADPQTWGILLQRDIVRNFEKTFWPRVTQNVSGLASQSADLSGLERISLARNMQFIPYGLFRAFRGLDLRDPTLPTFTARTAKVDGGVDSKFIVKDSLVFDFTVEPDFSQIESDQPQVTVSQRFEVFFPEKRPFFLENASYFATPINLFFTRRIVQPQFGARMTGRLGRYAIGVLAADDRAPGLAVPNNDPLAGERAHFAIARVARDILRDSTLGVIYTDREFVGSWNRVGGVDGRIRLSKDVITSFQAVESSTRNLDGSYLAGPAFEYDLTKNAHSDYRNLHYTGRSDGFRTLSGFDPQPDIHNVSMDVWHGWWPKASRYIQNWGPEINNYAIHDHEGNWINWGAIPQFKIQFQRQTKLTYQYAYEAETLRPRDFGVLAQNADFQRHTNVVQFSSAFFKQASFSVDYRWGRRVNYAPATGMPPYLARRNSVDVEMTLHPLNRLQIDNTYLWFREGGVGGVRAAAFNNHILRTKWNYQFTRELAARVILQYNSILSNPLWTSLAPAKNVNADVLISYLLHPGTAVYVGYNSDAANIDRALALAPDGMLLRTRSRFINDNREFFVKVSYLLRF